MAQKAYAKHSEYRTYSTKGNFDDKDFESMKTELLPKYGSLVQANNGVPAKNKEFYYEYKEEKNPAGTYDRKDLHTVEVANQYEYTHAPGESISYPNTHMISNTPQKITTTTVTTTNRDLTHNIEELDSLLDDLQRDQDRKMYKSGYTSDTMDSSSFDYRSSLPKSSSYNTRIEKDAEWVSPNTPIREVSREITRNQVTESHLVPANPQLVPAVICAKCQDHTNVQVSTTPMNKVTTTVKTYTYEVPADQDPTTIPIPGVTTSPTTNTTVAEKYVTNNRSYIQENHENRAYANTHFETSTPVKKPPPPPPSPQLAGGCQFCTHCNSRITTTNTTSLAGSSPHSYPLQPPGIDSTKVTTRTTHYTTEHKGSPYPSNSSPTYSVPIDNTSKQLYPVNNNSGPPGSSTYKYTTTNYTYNTVDGRPKPGPFPSGHLSPPSPSPFPRNESPAPRVQEPPKRLDELLADFPDADHRITDEGLRHRPNPARGPGGSSMNGHITMKESVKLQESNKSNDSAIPSKNVEGPAVYYPPGHEMFARGEESSAYQQAGGGYMKGKGKYEYEAKSSSKSKSSSGVTAVPVCLPLCCAMPCTIL